MHCVTKQDVNHAGNERDMIKETKKCMTLSSFTWFIVTVLLYQVTMVNSKQLANKLKSAPKILFRSRSVMQNSPTSVESDDNNDELVNTTRCIIKEELEEH